MNFLFEIWIAYRYLRSRQEEGFISIVSLFSFLGITLGVATLIIVMSVMNGFREEMLSRILGLNGHSSISISNDSLSIDLNKSLEKHGNDADSDGRQKDFFPIQDEKEFHHRNYIFPINHLVSIFSLNP